MGGKHRPYLWAIKAGQFIELYDVHPFDSDAVRIADFAKEDFALYFGIIVAPDDTPFCLRVYATTARNK